MIKKMLINASHPEECRVVVVADGVLEELDVHVNTREATLGNIYKGVITRIEPSLQAVFVDYGSQRNGFLPINDIHPSYFPESFEAGRKRPRIQEVFKRGDRVIVQVNKEERDNKGASLTTNISIAGRYLVLMPGTDLCGVSRKIEEDNERKKLKEILKQLTRPDNIGFIIRTAGLGKSKTELSRDLSYLLKLWESIEKNVAGTEVPILLYREQDVVLRSIKEHFSGDISEILVDEKEVFNKTKDFFRQVMPKYEHLVKLYQEKRPLFNKYQLEEQVEQAYRKRIRLKSGGYIVIEPTEALVTVDVNSGSATREKGIEETAFRVNMEAAVEIARQLRLRDLGGIIVVDFIDMMHKKHKQEVERAIKAELKKDRAKNKILRISALGCLELSRQRLKSSLGTGEYLECPHCDGSGRLKSPEMTALSVFRKIKSLLIKGDSGEVKATVPARTADYLLNKMREQLVDLERQHGSRITVLVNQNIPDKDIVVERVKEEIVEPVEPAITEAPQIEEAAPDQPVAVEAEPVAEPEQAGELDKGSARRTNRRRRRPRKRGPHEAVEDPAAVDLAEGTILEKVIWTAPPEGVSFQERLLAEACQNLDSVSGEFPDDETMEVIADRLNQKEMNDAAGRARPQGREEPTDGSETQDPGSKPMAMELAAETPVAEVRAETRTQEPESETVLAHQVPSSLDTQEQFPEPGPIPEAFAGEFPPTVFPVEDPDRAGTQIQADDLSAETLQMELPLETVASEDLPADGGAKAEEIPPAFAPRAVDAEDETLLPESIPEAIAVTIEQITVGVEDRATGDELSPDGPSDVGVIDELMPPEFLPAVVQAQNHTLSVESIPEAIPISVEEMGGGVEDKAAGEELRPEQPSDEGVTDEIVPRKDPSPGVQAADRSISGEPAPEAIAIRVEQAAAGGEDQAKDDNMSPERLEEPEVRTEPPQETAEPGDGKAKDQIGRRERKSVLQRYLPFA